MFYPTGTDWVAKKNDSSANSAPLREGSSDGSIDNSETSESGAGGGADSLENLSSVPVGLRIVEHLKDHGPTTQLQI